MSRLEVLLMKAHGVAEVVAGAVMMGAITQAFPFMSGLGPETQDVGRMFGAAITALGLTGFFATPSLSVLGSALFYHATVSGLLGYQLYQGNASDAASVGVALAAHSLFSVLFAVTCTLRALQKPVDSRKKK